MSRRSTRHKLRTGDSGWLTSYADLMTNLLIFFVLIVSASEIQTGRMERLMSKISGKTSGSLSEAQKTVENQIQAQNLQGKVTVRMTDAGLEISFNSGVTFNSGKADIRPEMLDPLTKVLTPLVPLSNKYQFAVEGHTDNVPIGANTAYKSNWELSSARALEVRDKLEGIGVGKTRIRVEAYADTRALPNDQVQGLPAEEVLARHRRVVVRLY
jgi:chemotaxis protein MotB